MLIYTIKSIYKIMRNYGIYAIIHDEKLINFNYVYQQYKNHYKVHKYPVYDNSAMNFYFIILC